MAQRALKALERICDGDDEAVDDRCDRAVVAGALEAAVVAMRRHPPAASAGCAALCILCYGAADTVEGRCQRAASAGAIEAVVSAMSLPTHAVEGQGDVQIRLRAVRPSQTCVWGPPSAVRGRLAWERSRRW